MVELLEERLGKLGNDVKGSVKNAFGVRHINPRENWQRMPYLKYDLVEAIGVSVGSIDVARTLYGAVNKDVLKRVYYGIASTGKLPKEYLDSLTDWEKVFLFRGRWSERNPNFNLPLDAFTVDHLKLGVDMLHKDHYVRKAQKKYASSPKFPESDSVREAYERINSRPRVSIVKVPQNPTFEQRGILPNPTPYDVD